MKVLIVDDHRAMRDLVKRLLADPAFEMRECDDGDQAADAYAAFAPDAVLMDFEMPRMDGLAATRAIRRLDPGADVLLLTQHDDDALRDAARDAGVSAYVLKENLGDLPSLLRARLRRTT